MGGNPQGFNLALSRPFPVSPQVGGSRQPFSTSRSILNQEKDTPPPEGPPPPLPGNGRRRWAPHPVAIISILLMASAAYKMGTINYEATKKRRKERDTAEAEAAAAAPIPYSSSQYSTTKSQKIKPVWEKRDVMVIFVLGGPGSGKGTNCAKLVEDFGFEHLSAGDLLREEQRRKGSQYGELIKECIREGKIVPMEVTIALLKKAMRMSNKGWFLIDGFPRAMDQAEMFEKVIVESTATLYFECPEATMLERLLKRGETSGRADDNIDSIRKRFTTFTDTSFPVIQHYQDEGKVIKVSCEDAPDQVYSDVKNAIEKLINDIHPRVPRNS